MTTVAEGSLSTRRLGSRGRQTLSAGAGTLLGNATGVLLPFLITLQYGSGRITDGYFLATASASFVVLLTAATESVSVVFFARLRAGQDATGGQAPELPAASVTAGLMRRSALCALALLVPVYLVTATVIVPNGGFSENSERDVLLLLLVLLPLPLAASASSVVAASHYAYGRFALATSTTGLRSLSALLCVLGGRAHLPLALVASALTVGELVRFAVLRRYAPCRQPSLLALTRAAPLAGFWRIAVPSVLGMAIIGVNPLVDKAVSAGIGSSSITTLELAEKLFYVPTILFGGMIASVLASEWASVHAQTGSRRAVGVSYWRAQRWILGASAAAAALAILVVAALGPAAGRYLGMDDGARFALVLAVYLTGLPAAFFVEVSGRLITTLGVNKILPWLASVALVVNLGLDLLGRELFGLVGIAMATTVVRVGSGVTMAWWLRRSFAQEPPVSPAAPEGTPA